MRDDVSRNETYSDRIRRLFPNGDFSPMHINGKHTKDVTFQVTDACNMACTYCYQHNKGQNSMSLDVAKRFIDMLLDSDEKSNKYITSIDSDAVIINFIGGEPLMEIDLINDITNYFIDQTFERKHRWATRYMISICSNGLLYFDPKVQAYLKRHVGHLSFSISIDGNKELHDTCRVDLSGLGTYDRAIAGVEHYAKHYNSNMGSKMTIAPENVSYVFEAVVNLINIGYREVLLNCVYEEGWHKGHASILYDQLKQLSDYLLSSGHHNDTFVSILDTYSGHPLDASDNSNWCGGSGLMIAVDYKGDIYPCLRYMESSIGENVAPFIIGNVFDGIMTDKEQCNRVDCLGCITRRSQSTDECFSCPIASGCGHCSALNYELYGTPNKRTTFICDMHKARVMASAYYINMRYIYNNVDGYHPLNIPDEWALEIIDEKELALLKNLTQ